MNTQSSRKIGVGIIGVGNWGRYGHIPVLRLLPNYEIVAVASRREEYGKQLAKEFGIPHLFTEAAELIGHPNVNLVVVLPPAPQHAVLVRAAIAAGKDVYCEWPLTTTVADTEDLLNRAEKAGVRHAVGLQRRMGPSARYLRDLLAEGWADSLRSNAREYELFPGAPSARPRLDRASGEFLAYSFYLWRHHKCLRAKPYDFGRTD